jgi:hypothetical protein
LAEANEKINKLFVMMDKKDNQILTIENFIDKYSPVRVQSQISEILHEVITDPREISLLY